MQRKLVSGIFIALLIGTVLTLCFKTAGCSSVGADWTKHPENPLDLEPERTGESWVLCEGEVYKMWYTGTDGSGVRRIYYATSLDGNNWTPYGMVLDRGGAGSWDEDSVQRPVVLFNGTAYIMWYLGYIPGLHRIGLATSTNGINWTKHETNPVLVPGGNGGWDDGGLGEFTVYFNGTTYIMWYNGVATTHFWQKIGVATSSDGISWTKYSGNPVLVPESSGWDSDHIYTGPVLRRGGLYYMWYSGQDYQTVRVGLASSPDGFSWTKYEGNPVLDVGSAGTWDSAYVFAAAMVEKHSELWMWYWGGSNPAGGTERIGLATRINLGAITWEKCLENPLDLGPGNVGWPWVIHDGEVFEMWYTGETGPEKVRKIYFADSPDGVDWTTHGIVLDTGEIGSWDDQRVAKPVVLFDGTTYKMWYQGNGNFRGMIGYATSLDGISWTKYEGTGGPVLVPGGNGGWDDWGISDLSVIFNGTHYIMWYGAQAVRDGTVRVGAASSVDGVSWTKHTDNPVLVPGPAEWDGRHVFSGPVISIGSYYGMWYTGESWWFDIPRPGLRVGVATSPDGFSWSKYEENPVLEPGPPGSWDSNSLLSPCIVEKGSTLFMYYTGVDSSLTSKIGLACVHNTPVGTEVTFADPVTGVTLVFDEVTEAGDTTVVTSGTGPPPPSGFRLVPSAPPVYYEITTTANYTGMIEIAMPYDESKVRNERNLRLMHWDEETHRHVDVTTWIDDENNVIHGEVSSLSVFATMGYIGPVGGIWTSVNKFELLAPWIGLASLITIATISIVFVKRRKKKQS